MKRILTLLMVFVITINPAVMDAFYRDGGTVSTAQRIVIGGDVCYGGYFWDDHRILITPDAPESTLPHEIGHYLYHKQVWSGELQDMANQAFAASPLRICDDETFARGYAMYCSGRLGGRLAEFYREIEESI